MSLLRFGFRRLEKAEKDEDGRKDVEESNLGSQEVKEKNQTAKKQPKRNTKKNERRCALDLEKSG